MFYAYINSVQAVAVLTTNKQLLFINYLRFGAIFVPSTKLISTEPRMLISDDISMARHCYIGAFVLKLGARRTVLSPELSKHN
jgi:hypothetical protein